MFYFSLLWIFFLYKVYVLLSWKRRQSKFTVNSSLETNLFLQIRWTFKPLWGGFAQWTTAGVFPLLMFAFKKKKTFFHFSIQISEKKKIISDGRHPPAGNRHWLWAHAMGWLKRSNAGIGWVAQGGPDKLPVAQEDIWEEHPSSWSQAAFASCLFKT